MIFARRVQSLLDSDRICGKDFCVTDSSENLLAAVTEVKSLVAWHEGVTTTWND